jgi:hypothetical protein
MGTAFAGCRRDRESSRGWRTKLNNNRKGKNDITSTAELAVIGE